MDHQRRLKLRSPSARGSAGLARRYRQAFSIIELMVVIGIIMIAMGLALPGLAKSRVEAERARQLAQIQQCAALVALYTADWHDTYPLQPENQFEAVKRWYKPLIEAGLAESLREIDATSFDKGLELAFFLSASMASDPLYYRPDAPLYPEWQFRPTSPVRKADVAFPASKGEVWTWRVGYTKKGNLDVWWCCRDDGSRVTAPIAFADGSAACAVWQDMLNADKIRPEGAGQPVISTWFGVRGRDR